MSDTVLTIQQVQRAALEAWRADQSIFSRSQESAKALGEALVKVHEKVGERGFKPWLKANAIDRNRAYYCVRLVNGKGPKAKAVAKHTKSCLFGCLTMSMSAACTCPAQVNGRAGAHQKLDHAISHQHRR